MTATTQRRSMLLKQKSPFTAEERRAIVAAIRSRMVISFDNEGYRRIVRCHCRYSGKLLLEWRPGDGDMVQAIERVKMVLPPKCRSERKTRPGFSSKPGRN